MIWRDDDIGVKTNLDDLRIADNILARAGLVHTIAVVAKDLDTRPDLVAFIRRRQMDVQLHGWNHNDLTTDAQAREELPQAVALLEQLFGRRPHILYPPWNRTSPELEEAAAALGLTISHAKISLEQFVRAQGDVIEETINFHYWHPPDVAALEEAVRIVQEQGPMKKTDYCPRAAPFDSYLTGRGLVGVEVGVDVGAHAEALLRYVDIAHITLVDTWPREYQYGYCDGRLKALGLGRRFSLLPRASVQAAAEFGAATLDFVYIDQVHDGSSVAADLEAWWPILKPRGLLGYRNYRGQKTPLDVAVDAFIARTPMLNVHVEDGEIVLVKP